MPTFILILSFFAFCASPVMAALGLVSPNLALPKFVKKSRKKVLQVYGSTFGASFVLMLLSSMAISPDSISMETTAVEAPSEAVAPQAASPVAQSPVPSPQASALAQTAPAASDQVSATVVSVGDGDTIQARIEGAVDSTTIRLACIDAPETRQPQGAESANRLRSLLPREANIEVRAVDTDRYGRTVAEVYQNGTSVNLQLVQEGRAVVYRDYLSDCAGDRYLAAEASARQQRLGFWSQSEPIMPWDWRQGARPAASTPAPTPVAQPSPVQSQATSSNCDPSYPSICIPAGSPDLDCGDISERRFTVRPPDPHGFDREGDGIGCES